MARSNPMPPGSPIPDAAAVGHAAGQQGVTPALAPRGARRFEGKVAVVTGGASGIGRATAELLAAEGAAVVVGDWTAAAGEQVAAGIRERGGSAHFVHVDVSQRADARRLADEAVATFGGIDILVNAAGIGLPNHTVETTEEDAWDLVLGVNLRGIYLASKFAIPHLRARGSGAIVNISSVQAFTPLRHNAPYAASKGGVLTLSREMAIDYYADGIRVNCVCPGAVYTGLTEQRLALEGKTRGDIQDRFDPRRLGRTAEASELAKAIAFLSSDDASFAVGGTYVFDGGGLLRRP